MYDLFDSNHYGFNFKYLSSIDIDLDHSLLQKILEYLVQNASVSMPLGKQDPFWLGQRIRGVDMDTVPEELKSLNPAQIEFFLRQRTDVSWNWVDTPITQTVYKLLEPISSLYKTLTRVKIFAQIPTKAILPHRDLVAGAMYNRMHEDTVTRLGTNLLRYNGEEWFKKIYTVPDNFAHAEQGYLALKIPLDFLQPGRSYLCDFENNRYYYDPSNKPYLLNEYEILHGVDAGDQWRGVVFLDGILDISKINCMQKPMHRNS
jgi:hypothetical protein